MKKSSMPPTHHHPFYSPILEEPEKQVAKSFRVVEKGPVARSHALDHQKKEAAAAAAAPKKLERKTTDINESCDAFIKNFRKQLMIQRLESIENYEQMLARGL